MCTSKNSTLFVFEDLIPVRSISDISFFDRKHVILCTSTAALQDHKSFFFLTQKNTFFEIAQFFFFEQYFINTDTSLL